MIYKDMCKTENNNKLLLRTHKYGPHLKHVCTYICVLNSFMYFFFVQSLYFSLVGQRYLSKSVQYPHLCSYIGRKMWNFSKSPNVSHTFFTPFSHLSIVFLKGDEKGVDFCISFTPFVQYRTKSVGICVHTFKKVSLAD